jgi:hypothetical protein
MICLKSNAQSMDYKIEIFDSCSSSYSGPYNFNATCGIVNGNQFCVHYGTIQKSSTIYHITYQCSDWPACESNSNYYVTVSACRQNNCQGCNGTKTVGGYVCTDLQNGNAFVPVVIH